MQEHFIGKYRVLERVGHGGMGTVYRALDPVLNRDVAIKVVSGIDLDQDSLRRFAREAQAAARLNHPNIVVVHDFGSEDGTPYLVMEYLEGTGLDQAIDERRPFSLQQKLRIIIDACHALGHAHGRGVLHRDIKPANLWITKEGVAKVLDFGIAVIEGEGLTTRGHAIGTPYYVSPEAIRGEEPDARSDLFSLTVTLYEWLTFEKPFGTGTPVEVIARIADSEPRPIEALLPQCPQALADVIQTGLRKDRERRFSSAAAMASALADIVAKDIDAEDERERLLTPAAKVQPEAEHSKRERRWFWPAGVGVLVVLGMLAMLFGGRFLTTAPGAPSQPIDAATSRGSQVVVAPLQGSPSRQSAANRPAAALEAPPPSSPVALPENQPERQRPVRESAATAHGARLPVAERRDGAAVDATQPEPGIDERGIVLPIGTTMMVSLVHELWSDKVGTGEEFEAVLAGPLEVHGTVVAPAGTPVVGNVDAVGRLDRPDSRPFILLSITKIGIPVNLPIRTASYRVVAPPVQRGVDVTRLVIAIGAGAGVGALIAGTSGAVVGAGSGAAATALRRSDQPPEYRVTAPLPFRLAQRVVVPPSVPKEALP